MWPLVFTFFIRLMCPRCVHIIACQCFIFSHSWIYSIVWVDYVLVTCSSVSGLLGCFHLLAIMNHAAVNIHTHILCRHMFSGLLGIYVPLSRISGSGGNSVSLFEEPPGSFPPFHISTSNEWRWPLHFNEDQETSLLFNQELWLAVSWLWKNWIIIKDV